MGENAKDGGKTFPARGTWIEIFSMIATKLATMG